MIRSKKFNPIPIAVEYVKDSVIDIEEQEQHPMTFRSRNELNKWAWRSKVAIGVQLMLISIFEFR